MAEARGQLEEALDTSLPDDFGQLTLMSGDQLNQLHDGVVGLDRLMWVLIALAAILLVASLLVSPNRSRTSIHLAIGVVIAIALALVSVSWLQNSSVDAIVEPGDAGAARKIISEVLTTLRQGAVLIALIAIVAAAVVWYSSRSPKTPESPAETIKG